MHTITATTPCFPPPTWALLERQLLARMNEATAPFLARYVREDGELIWREGGTGSRDGADDFYESAFNWPLLYLLGGSDHLLHEGQRLWDSITRQLTRAGMVYKEYELGYDQFHQGESYIYFYFLCLADPTNELNRARAQRFAGFYLNEDPEALNYDPEHKIIRAAHNGSGGPRWGFSDSTEPSYGWGASMRIYGLPFHDLPNIEHYDDLHDPVKARQMGQAMYERMGRGDVAGNLIVTSLVANAYLMTGDTKYRDWIVEYVDGWLARAQANGGLLPDNVGLAGQVGEYMDGKWYGGLYGWTWPHGYYNIGMAATVAGLNAYLLTGETAYLELPRSQFDYIWALGEKRDLRTLEMSLGHHWLSAFTAQGEPQTDDDYQMFVAPYRYGDHGWFDYQPLSPVYPTALWNISMAAADWARIEALRQAEKYDWRTVIPFRNKEDAGHEQPWLRYLAGENPTYPETILRATIGMVNHRLALIAHDQADLTKVNIHHWQEHNPIICEALVQLTLGAPQFIYNGGLLHCRVRYFDADQQRPGLPTDVAALVETITDERTVVNLVNLSPTAERTVIVQAGGFGEHRFETATYDVRTSDYPGTQKAYAPPPLVTKTETVPVNDRYVQIVLPPSTQIKLDLATARYVNQPSYALPW
ncbi:MAG: hypothetical protein KF832_11080 [Caldilineaceae bacterium]|nr:hypothetical protein [Caldilineaceae bacterium]